MNSAVSDEESARLTQLKTLLDAAGVDYDILVHDRNYATADDGVVMGLGTLLDMAPTFILRTEVGYMAAIVRGDTRLAYRKIKKQFHLKNVALASPEEVKQLTGSEIGWVALINPGLKTIVDQRLIEVEAVFGGSGVANHTLRISPQSVIVLNSAQVFDFTESK